MLKKLDKMKMKQKMIFGYAVVIGMMIILVVCGIIGLNLLKSRFNDYLNGSQRADTAVKMCRIYTNSAARSIREMVLNDDKSTYADYRETIDSNIKNLEEELVVLKDTGMLDDSLYQRYEQAVTDWVTIGEKIVSVIEEGDRKKATAMILEECTPALQNTISVVNEINEITEQEKEEAVQTSLYTVVVEVILFSVILVISIVLAMITGKRIIESITRPLRGIETVAKELSDGNLHSQLEYHSDDEIGNLAHSLRKSIRILASYVDDIDRAMKEFSSGNFDVQPEVEWKGDFISIRDSILGFERTMSDTVKNIQRVADQVTNGAEQVSASSMDLAQGASEQAGITEELTATIESVSEKVHQNAENAKNISKEVENVGIEIINSNGKMQEMVESMSEINESSREISKIIATINDIASQTNLLALNASIEAARAGEAGKGFAVVADQVSVLAAQSAKAAKESTKLIETSVQAVGNGMIIANQTAEQLENVVKGSKEITEKVNLIAEASEEQSESISQINDGVEHINGVVQTNSANTEECAAASQEMSKQAETLEKQIRRFKVGKFN